MNEIERKAREDFFTTTGKTPEQEASDSSRVLRLCLVGVALIAIGLLCYLFS
jgi:hypothetical protein